jgi:hypothetical protein
MQCLICAPSKFLILICISCFFLNSKSKTLTSLSNLPRWIPSSFCEIVWWSCCCFCT